MLVDDDEIANIVHETLLSHHVPDKDLEIFSSPERALAYLDDCVQEQRPLPGLIFLDINMPKLNGWEFLEKIRERKYPARVCMLTSSIDEGDESNAKRFQEVIKFISKPLAENHLQELFPSPDDQSMVPTHED